MTSARRMAELESLRANLLTRLSGLDSPALNRKPADGGWSAAQVLAHVILAERLSVAYLRKKVKAGASIPKTGVATALKSWALGRFLRLPFKVKAPGRTDQVPEHAELDELERNWSEVRRDLEAFVEQYPEELAGAAIYKHPLAGRLSLDQTLQFLIDHLRRHGGQIERVLAGTAGGPAA